MRRTRTGRRRLRVERLEPRLAPAINFSMALGVGISAGQYTEFRANAVAEDAGGDLVVVGSIRGTANFDPGSGTTNLSNSGNQDAFVAEYTSAGALAWAETFPGQSASSVAEATAVAVDGSGNILVTGSFSGTIKVGAGAGALTMSAPSRTDAYAVKLAGSGQPVWAVASAGQTYDSDTSDAIVPDGSGGAYIAGNYMDSAAFGGTTLTAAGLSEAFAAHVNASGSFTWARSTVGSGTSQAGMHGLAVDPAGRLVMAGYYAGTVNFDPSGGTGSTLTAVGSRDAAVWVLDGSGHIAWARGVGGADFDEAAGVAVDPSGNVYATGAFGGTVNFDPAGPPASLSATGTQDVFVLKLGPTGAFGWAVSFDGSAGASEGEGIAVDGQGRVVVGGWFTGSVKFDPSGVAPALVSAGAEDVFAAVLDGQGAYQGAVRGGGANSDMALGLALNASGTVALAGMYTGPAGFGSTSLPAKGPESIFVAGLSLTNTTPPAPPAPTLDASSNSGGTAANLTNVTSPVFDVSATSPGLTVQLYRDGALVGSRVGTGTIADPGPVPEGVHQYVTKQVDAFNDTGPASPSTSVTIDTTPPARPPAPALLPADDSGTRGDGITDVNPPRLTGTAEPNATVQVLDAGGHVVASGTADPNGNYTILLPAFPKDGTYSFSARAIDLAKNVGQAGPAFALTIDTTPPLAPSILTLAPADDSGTPGDKITNVVRPHLIGTAEAYATVTLLDGSGSPIGQATAGPDGSFTIQPTAALPSGPDTLSVRATDAAGNAGPAGPTTTITILTTPPAMPTQPTLALADDSGVKGDGVTNLTKPHVVGKATAGVAINLYGPAGLIGTAVADANGNYSVAPSSALPDGPITVYVRAVDVAANQSVASPSATITIRTAPPPAPPAPVLDPRDDSGTPGDRITNNRTPRFDGTVPAGDTVNLLNASGAVLGTTTADPSTGAYVVAVSPSNPLPEGPDSLSIQVIDYVGNLGAAGPALVVTIDTTPPLAPTGLALSPADDSGVKGDRITNVTRPHLTGTAEAYATVTLLDGSGNAIGQATAGANGSFTIQPTAALPPGPGALSVRATDAAGNTGPAGPSLTITILTAPPAPPTAGLLNADDTGVKGDGVTRIRHPRIVGVAPAGAEVDLLDGSGTLVASTTADPSTGAYTIRATAGSVGTYAYSVRATDVAGNQGAAGPSFSVRLLATAGDFDGDGMADPATYNPTTAVWTIRASATGIITSRQFGEPNVDIPEPADYFGDGRTDIAVYRPTTGEWFILNPSTGGVVHYTFGQPGVDIPVPGDYDGDGKADVAFYRPTTAQWFIMGSKTGVTTTTAFGWANNDQPVPADYDGDGKMDMAVFRPTTDQWFVRRSTDGTTATTTFGWVGHDRPIPADFDGDGMADIAVYRPSTAQWFIDQSSTGTTRTVTYGWAGLDQAIPEDFNGDGQVDLTVWRPTTAQFYIMSSIDGSKQVVSLGTPGVDRPALLPLSYQLVGLTLQNGSDSTAGKQAPSKNGATAAAVPTRPVVATAFATGPGRTTPARSVLVETPRARYPGPMGPAR